MFQPSRRFYAILFVLLLQTGFVCTMAGAFPALAYERHIVRLGPKIESPVKGRQVTVTDTETSGVYDLTVMDNGEILHGEDIYRYTYTDEDQSIAYPDGNRCNNFGYGYLVDHNGRMLTDDARGSYLPALVLIRALEAVEDAKWKPHGGLIFSGIVLLGLGLFTCLKPRLAYHLDEGWQYQNLEPSELNLGFRTLGGGIAALGGLIIAIIGLMG